MPSVKTDILVIGAGPAGGAAALTAARSGVHVTLVDRAPLGGEQGMKFGFVPLNFAPELELPGYLRLQNIRGTRIDMAGEVMERRWPGHIIKLGEMSLILVGDAGKQGADLRAGYNLDGLSPTGVARFTSIDHSLSVKAKVVVACDGALSPAAQHLGFAEKPCLHAVQCEIPLLMDQDWVEFFLHTSFTGGFAWLFPRHIVASVGVATREQQEQTRSKLLMWFRDRMVRAGRIGGEMIKQTMGAIPVGGLLPQLRVGQVILAGDAAGTAHPMAMYGITPALQSGMMAGRAAADFVRGTSSALQDYEHRLKRLLGPMQARAIARRQFMEEAWERIDFRALMQDTCLGP